MIKHECAGCHKTLGYSPGGGTHGVSHGLCDACKTRLYPDIFPAPVVTQETVDKLQDFYDKLDIYSGKPVDSEEHDQFCSCDECQEDRDMVEIDRRYDRRHGN